MRIRKQQLWLAILLNCVGGGGTAGRDGGKSPIGGGKVSKATPPIKEKIDHTKCDIVPGQDTIIEIIKVS